jgi:hypothetical protein
MTLGVSGSALQKFLHIALAGVGTGIYKWRQWSFNEEKRRFSEN